MIQAARQTVPRVACDINMLVGRCRNEVIGTPRIKTNSLSALPTTGERQRSTRRPRRARTARPLQKAVDGSKGTCGGKREHEPMAALFEGVCHEHGGDGKQAERRQQRHDVSSNAYRKPCEPSGPVSSKAIAPTSGSTRRSNLGNRQLWRSASIIVLCFYLFKDCKTYFR